MSEFEREDRYAVIKYKKLTDQQWTLVPTMLENFDGARVDCVVVEKDWPEYNFVWLMLGHRMAGYPVPDFNAVKCAADVAVAQAELETSKATIAQLTAENERLKGGQGEPAGYFTFCADKQVWKHGKPKGVEFLHLFTPLHTSQPAPVSVVPFKMISLPPSLIDHHAFDVLQDELAKVGIKVKELTQ